MRDGRIDFIKGVAIMLMVFCHAIDNSYEPIRRFVSLFHMPVFLIASGFFFAGKVSSLKSVGVYIGKKVKTLWWPYVFWGLAFIARARVHNLFLTIGFYTNDPAGIEVLRGRWVGLNDYYTFSSAIPYVRRTIFMLHGEPVAGAMWFLQMLFWVSILYAIVERSLISLRLNALILQTAISAIFLIIANTLSIKALAYLGGMRVLACYGLFHLGVIARRFAGEINGFLSRFNVLPVLFVSFLLLVGLSFYENVALSRAMYVSAPTLVMASACGWIMLCCLNDICIKHIPVVTTAILFIGQHTLPILILHLLTFKFINVFACALTGKGRILWASYPASHEEGFWPIIYTASGVLVPLLLWFLYDKAKRRMHA